MGLSDSNPAFAGIAGAKEAVEKAKTGIVDGSIKVATE